jgi:hypothetical protein
MRKRPLLLLALLALALAAGYSAYWWQAARAVRLAVEDWAESQRARGGRVEHAGLSVRGFPLALVARATAPEVRLPEGPEWRGPEIVARAAPWDPTRVALELPGVHRLSIPAAGARPALELVASGGGTGAVEFRLGRGPSSARLALEGVAFGPVGREAGRVLAERAALRVSLPPADGPVAAAMAAATTSPAASPSAPPAAPPAAAEQPASLSLALSAEALLLPEGAATPLGREVARAGIEARVLGPLPAGTEPEALAAWSRAGGALALDRLDLDWGPLRAVADGRVALDAALVPTGALDAEILGANPTIDALAAAGAMRPRDATLAKVAVNFLARNKTPDGEPIVEAPVVLRDGWAHLGPVRLAPLPRLGP